jgi:hypothetical protein
MEYIGQKHYGLIEVDNSEKDIVVISCKQKIEFNVIQIEREKLIELIELLKAEL